MNELSYVIIGVLFFGVTFQAFAGEPFGDEQYLSLLNDSVVASRKQMPKITLSAEKAAKLILAGGTIWAGGRQPEFASEAGGRAGGLMALRHLDEKAVKKNDVVLYAVPGCLNNDDLKKIKKWSRNGIEIVAFAALDKKAITAGNLIHVNEPASEIGFSVIVNKQKKICPIDTLTNIINLWTWTGEFVAACTREGKMPVLYQSFGIPGGVERAKKYQGKIFHDDLTIKQIKPGVLGSDYLDVIEASIRAIKKNELSKIRQSAAWWQSAGEKNSQAIVMGHMFPAHFKDLRAPQIISLETGWHDQKVKEKSENCRFILFVGYQYSPQSIASQVVNSNFKLVYSTVQPANPVEVDDKIIYINPHWPLADGCVNVPGYDVPILPASGVLNAAIYWTILAQRCEIVK